MEQAEPPYRVLECAECTMVYVDPLPDASELAQHYDRHYYSEWVSRQRPRRERMWRDRLDIVHRWASGGHLLDVGCGEGHFLEVAKARGWCVAGTEVSVHAAEVAAQRLGRPIHLGELPDAGLPPTAYDVVTMWHTLEHMLRPMSVLTEVRRLVKADGVLVLAVPNVNDRLMQAAYRLARGRRPRLFSLRDREIHLHHFSADSLTRMLGCAGFRCLNVGPDNGIVEPLKSGINRVAAWIHRTAGVHWYNSIQVIARPA